MFRYLIVLLISIFLMAGCSKKSKEDLYTEGVKLMKDGNANGAIVLFKNAIEIDQNYVDARFQLAKAYAATKKYEQAEKEFQKVLRQNPSRKEIKLELAKTYNLMGKADDAIAEAENYRKSFGENADVYEIIGTAYKSKNDLGQAESFFLKSISLDKEKISSKLDLAAVYVQERKEQDARALIDEILKKDDKNVKALYMLATLENSLGKSDKALEIFQKLVQVNPADSKAKFNVGMILINKGNVAEAEKIADEIIKKYPKRAEGPHLKGLVYYQKRDWANAISALQNSIKLQENMMAYYHLGLSLYNKGDNELALSQFRKIMDYYPSFNPARLMTAVIFLKQKRVDDCISELKKLLQKDGDNALAHNILGSAYIAKGQSGDAIAEFDKAIKADPKFVDAHLKKGLFNLDRGNARGAEIELQTAVNLAPEVLNSRFILSSYYVNQRNYPKALSVLKDGLKGLSGDAVIYNSMATVQFAAKNEADAVRYLQKAKEVNPALAAPVFNLAVYYASKGDIARALDEYKGILKHNPQEVNALINCGRLLESKGNKEEALKYYQMARDTKQTPGYVALAGFYLGRKETGKAIDILDAALKEDARNASLMEMKGKLLLSERKYDEALRVFEGMEQIAPDAALTLKVAAYTAKKDYGSASEIAQRVVRQKPDSAYGFTLLASVYESQGDTARAIETLKNGIRIEPKNNLISMLLGNLYVRKKDYSSAVAIFQSVEKRNPKHFSAIFAQGLAFDQMGKKSEAAKKYRQTLALSPNYVPALNNLAYILTDGNKTRSDALKLAAAALKNDPDNPGVMDTMGYVLLRNGKKAEARAMLEKAAKLMPKNPTVYYHLALAYRDLRDNGQAIKSAQHSLDLGEFPESRAARTLLAEMRSR